MENRKRYIREVLDEDMNMKQRVVDLNRYRVMGIVDEVTPYIQIDQDEINKMRAAAATLSQVLEKKALLANQIRSATDEEEGVNANIIDLAHTEEVLAAFNAVVTVYLNPRNTQETKSYISQVLTSFEGKVSENHRSMQDIIAKYEAAATPTCRVDDLRALAHWAYIGSTREQQLPCQLHERSTRRQRAPSEGHGTSAAGC